mmetsp:Transcript_14866/g.37833  ORF Transcript_14866/g.37833 Transcript_14866/m.37833 type:complete len:281 (-) Transcript_14866:430-1272(-)
MYLLANSPFFGLGSFAGSICCTAEGGPPGMTAAFAAAAAPATLSSTFRFVSTAAATVVEFLIACAVISFVFFAAGAWLGFLLFVVSLSAALVCLGARSRLPPASSSFCFCSSLVASYTCLHFSKSSTSSTGSRNSRYLSNLTASPSKHVMYSLYESPPSGASPGSSLVSASSRMVCAIACALSNGTPSMRANTLTMSSTSIEPLPSGSNCKYETAASAALRPTSANSERRETNSSRLLRSTCEMPPGRQLNTTMSVIAVAAFSSTSPLTNAASSCDHEKM